MVGVVGVGRESKRERHYNTASIARRHHTGSWTTTGVTRVECCERGTLSPLHPYPPLYTHCNSLDKPNKRDPVFYMSQPFIYTKMTMISKQFHATEYDGELLLQSREMQCVRWWRKRRVEWGVVVGGSAQVEHHHSLMVVHVATFTTSLTHWDKQMDKGHCYLPLLLLDFPIESISARKMLDHLSVPRNQTSQSQGSSKMLGRKKLINPSFSELIYASVFIYTSFATDKLWQKYSSRLATNPMQRGTIAMLST